MNSDTNSKNTAHEINAVNVANDAQKIAPKATQQSSCETVDAEFKPLTTTFKAVIKEPYSKLGSELQKLWSQKISPYVHWDNASFYERLKRVEIFDRLNDPQKEEQRKKELDAYAQAFEIYAEIGEVEIEAQKIELMNPQDLSQDAHKKSEKHRFNQEIGRLMQKLELMTDEQTAPSLPTSDSDQISAIENPAPAPADEVEVAKAQTPRHRDDLAEAKANCSTYISTSAYPRIAEYKDRKDDERNQPWSAELVEEVYKFYQKHGLKSTAEELGISQAAVTKHLSKKKKEKAKHAPWFPT